MIHLERFQAELGDLWDVRAKALVDARTRARVVHKLVDERFVLALEHRRPLRRTLTFRRCRTSCTNCSGGISLLHLVLAVRTRSRCAFFLLVCGARVDRRWLLHGAQSVQRPVQCTGFWRELRLGGKRAASPDGWVHWPPRRRAERSSRAQQHEEVKCQVRQHFVAASTNGSGWSQRPRIPSLS